MPQEIISIHGFPYSLIRFQDCYKDPFGENGSIHPMVKSIINEIFILIKVQVNPNGILVKLKNYHVHKLISIEAGFN